VNFITGPGGAVGDTLVTHPKTRYIGFTVRRKWGCASASWRGRPLPGQMWIKRTVLEMGGKDGIVVDEEADIDRRWKALCRRRSAIKGKNARHVRAPSSPKRFTTLSWIAGGAHEENHCRAERQSEQLHGPVVSQSAMKTILDYIEVGKKEGKLLTGGKRAAGDGYFIEPTIIADVDPKARLAQEKCSGRCWR